MIEQKIENVVNAIMNGTNMPNESERLNITTIKSGIYLIVNKVNGKWYVGSSINIDNRIKGHINNLKSNRHGNYYLQQSFNKYGINSFEFVKLYYVEPILEKCHKIENEYLLVAKNNRDTSYNLKFDAVGGGDFPEEIRLKISDSKKGEKNHFYKYKKSQTHIDNLKKVMTGNKWNVGRKQSDEEKLKKANAIRGIKRSDEFKEKCRINIMAQLKSGNINNKGKENHKSKPIKATFVDGRIEEFKSVVHLKATYPDKKYDQNIYKLINKKSNRIKDLIGLEYLILPEKCDTKFHA